MFKLKSIYLKLFLATLLTITGIHSSNNYFTSQVSAQETIQKNTYSSELVAKKSKTSRTRKSGGRSGGGSFKSKSKSRSSGSSSKKRSIRNQSRPSNSRRDSTNNHSPRRDYRDDYEPNPTYNNQKNYTPNYDRTSTRGSSYSRQQKPMHPIFRFILITLLLSIVGAIIFIPLFILFKFLSKYFSKDSRETRQVQKEINNDKVTVSKIQIALSSEAVEIQQDLSELSLTANTDTPEGLLELMRDSSLIIVRHSQAWTHVLSNSISMAINKAESAFDSLSVAERSKYDGESLSNVNGNIKIREQVSNSHRLLRRPHSRINKTTEPAVTVGQDEFADYLVVTLIFGTVDDKPLFEKINNEQQLEATLLKLAAMRADYLIKFELLWSPQTEGIYLTDEELLMKYTEMIPLV
ncbi:conserved exported hypothetical protein [Hyella patelloides LEGE 07179]|uniref:DUF1517 domain-containing protein n=1 Tax=Hyella patelloides LEGE 07179 TaxID=945734 RepID=A0A563VPS8_9CYAN|nr:DUF1517 domain-containing protein [Hyella patelloides]VEP13472.1 conserved exported hypothetical protein [Hyella patelloides LEGE 07179]